MIRSLFALSLLVATSAAQAWQETRGRTAAGLLAMRQAARDASQDSLVLIVASHPDDRYILPAIWLRRTFGLRVAV
ncbi:MAG: hypothetical protein VYD05_13155, partial [Planctomycetota bacterium]|nr:hypothetical protein [Planctomycetota bacterium]